MSTQSTHLVDPTAIEQPSTHPAAETATASAPRTFSPTNTDRLRNLIDEWNACLDPGR